MFYRVQMLPPPYIQSILFVSFSCDSEFLYDKTLLEARSTRNTITLVLRSFRLDPDASPSFQRNEHPTPLAVAVRDYFEAYTHWTSGFGMHTC